MRLLSNYDNNDILPFEYCEVDYLDKIYKILNNTFDDSFDLYIIDGGYGKEIIKDTNNVTIGIHVGNEGWYDDRLYDKFDLVFRFYFHDYCDNVKVFPINIGHNSWGLKNINFNNQKKLSERKNDVFFIGQLKDGIRDDFHHATQPLTSKYDIRFSNGFRQGVPFMEYLDILSDTKICLVPRGVSNETFRYSEAFASGCIVITTVSPSHINTWYYKDSPAIFINNWSELTDELITKVLSSNIDEKYEENKKYYNDFLSPEANANFIINKINNFLEKK
jgi:hypothetical protein